MTLNIEVHEQDGLWYAYDHDLKSPETGKGENPLAAAYNLLKEIGEEFFVMADLAAVGELSEGGSVAFRVPFAEWSRFSGQDRQ